MPEIEEFNLAKFRYIIPKTSFHGGVLCVFVTRERSCFNLSHSNWVEQIIGRALFTGTRLSGATTTIRVTDTCDTSLICITDIYRKSVGFVGFAMHLTLGGSKSNSHSNSHAYLSDA